MAGDGEARAGLCTWVRISGTIWVQPPFSPPGSRPSARNCSVSQAIVRALALGAGRAALEIVGGELRASIRTGAADRSAPRRRASPGSAGGTTVAQAASASAKARTNSFFIGPIGDFRARHKAARPPPPLTTATKDSNPCVLPSALLLLPLAAAALAQPASAPIHYPDTPRGDVVEEQFGERVADPYRWLENDVRQDEQVRAWVTAQNEVTQAFLATLPARAAFRARMTQMYDYERFGLPERKGSRYFYTRNDGLQNQAVLYVREGLNGAPRMLIDPNTWSQDGATALAEWDPSEDGRFCSIRSRTAAPTGAPCACSTSPPASRPATRCAGSNSPTSTGPRTARASIIRASPSRPAPSSSN